MSELKAINALGIRKDDGAYYDRSQVDKYIDELDERHTAEITALEVSYRLQLDGLRYDNDAEIRKLKRALWLARVTIAHSTKYKYHRLGYKAEIDPQPHGWSCYINGEVYQTGKMNRRLEPHYWIELWEEVERKCRAKAKEYK